MSYAQELRLIADEAGRREKAISRLAFCYDVWLHHTQDGGEPTRFVDGFEAMNGEKATRQMEEAIRSVIGIK